MIQWLFRKWVGDFPAYVYPKRWWRPSHWRHARNMTRMMSYAHGQVMEAMRQQFLYGVGVPFVTWQTLKPEKPERTH